MKGIASTVMFLIAYIRHYPVVSTSIHYYALTHTHKVQHNSAQLNTTQLNTIQHNTTQHNSTQHKLTQFNSTQSNTTQLNTTLTQQSSTQHLFIFIYIFIFIYQSICLFVYLSLISPSFYLTISQPLSYLAKVVIALLIHMQ